MIKYLKKNWKIIAFAAVVLLAIFLRVWHFSDWLFFKMDQARDAILIKQALDLGPGWLPLLGPKAGGTHLNLGPAFYLFQYLAAVLFQSAHPAILAYPDLIFAILSVPLFYLFAKKYFSRDWAMILAGLYALCFLGIEYSRFAWNPNSLVFFNLLYFYSLLNAFDERVKYKFRWVVAAGLSFAVSTQLHFLSFATLPVITAIFIFFNRQDVKKHLGWKNLAVFVGVILLVYLPVVANEAVTHGKNTTEFFAAVKSKPSHHGFWQNIKRDFRYWGQNWFLILTGWISKKGSFKPALIAWLGVMLPGLYLSIRNFRNEKNSPKKKFLLITILWFFAYFLIYIPIAYQIRPRFFLPLLALPFVFVGYIAKFFWEKNKKLLKAGVIAALAIMFLGNLAGTYCWFKEIKSAQKKGIYPKRTIILKARDGIVLWHLEKAAQYVKSECGSPNVYHQSPTEYKYPLRYVLALEGLKGVSLKNYEPGQSGCFFYFGLTRSKKGIGPDLAGKFEAEKQQKFGALSVYKLNPKENFLSGNKPKKEKPEEKRIFWEDIVK